MSGWREQMGLTHAAHPRIARAAHWVLDIGEPEPAWARRLWDWASARKAQR